jgi:hypothetical protein
MPFLEQRLRNLVRLMGDAEMESSMDKSKYLTAEEVSERYRGGISVGTLRNWRAMRIGPDFVKIGKAAVSNRGTRRLGSTEYSDVPCVKTTRHGLG